MKAESFFKHIAVSKSGAMGLMQIMPKTGRGIARGMGHRKYNLHDPRISIQYGTKYFSWLNRYFKGNVNYSISSYNAGIGNVRKWKKKYILKKRKKKNFDKHFFELIPFIETKKYLLRCRKYYSIYSLIYK